MNTHETKSWPTMRWFSKCNEIKRRSFFFWNSNEQTMATCIHNIDLPIVLTFFFLIKECNQNEKNSRMNIHVGNIDRIGCQDKPQDWWQEFQHHRHNSNWSWECQNHRHNYDWSRQFQRHWQNYSPVRITRLIDRQVNQKTLKVRLSSPRMITPTEHHSHSVIFFFGCVLAEKRGKIPCAHRMTDWLTNRLSL